MRRTRSGTNVVTEHVLGLRDSPPHHSQPEARCTRRVRRVEQRPHGPKECVSNPRRKRRSRTHSTGIPVHRTNTGVRHYAKPAVQSISGYSERESKGLESVFLRFGTLLSTSRLTNSPSSWGVTHTGSRFTVSQFISRSVWGAHYADINATSCVLFDARV